MTREGAWLQRRFAEDERDAPQDRGRKGASPVKGDRGRSSKLSSLWTREKRRGLKLCTREVEGEAEIAQLFIFEMEQKAALPDLSWDRGRVCS
jgi:hypothetical protein